MLVMRYFLQRNTSVPCVVVAVTVIAVTDDSDHGRLSTMGMDRSG